MKNDVLMWSMVLRPFGLVIFMFLVVLPLKSLFVRFFPEGKTKRILLTKLN